MNEELKFLRKFQKKKFGEEGCERRIEVFVKIQKKTFSFFFFLGGGGGGGGREGVGLGGSVWR